MQNIIRYTLLTAMRDWLFIGILALVLVAIFLSAFLGNTAISEQREMATAFIGGSTRMITIMGLILFVCFHIRRSFENKEIELILSKPITRVQFIYSYFIGFASLSLTIILPIIALIFILNTIGYLSVNGCGLLIWGFTLYLETLILMTFAFFASLRLKSAVSSVMLCFAFYLLSRIFGFFLISINNPASLAKSSPTSAIMEQILNILGIFIPRLDMFTKSEWLVHGIANSDHIILFSLSSIIYVLLLLAMTIFDLLRKQF